MRSCEYSDVQGEQRTKLLCVRNIRFFDSNNRDISKQYNYIEFASTVSVTFEFQKKEVRNDTISHQRSGDSLAMGEMCPVKAMANIIKQIRSYDISDEKLGDTPINYVEFDGKGFTIPSSLILIKIREAVATLGHEMLGFLPEDVGTHSPMGI